MEKGKHRHKHKGKGKGKDKDKGNQYEALWYCQFFLGVSAPLRQSLSELSTSCDFIIPLALVPPSAGAIIRR